MAGKLKLEGEIAEKALEMLSVTADILDNSNVPYVLEAGTLLGVVREQRLLPWDNDLDITITSKYAKRLLKIRYKFWLAGYRTRIRRYKKDIGPLKKGWPRILRIQTKKFFFFKEHSLLDIFIKYPVEDKYFWAISDKQPVLKSVPLEYYDNHTKIKFNGKMYSAPKDYEGFLEYCYGDWRTPVKDWNFRTGDNCVEKVYD